MVDFQPTPGDMSCLHRINLYLHANAAAYSYQASFLVPFAAQRLAMKLRDALRCLHSFSNRSTMDEAKMLSEVYTWLKVGGGRFFVGVLQLF